MKKLFYILIYILLASTTLAAVYSSDRYDEKIITDFQKIQESDLPKDILPYITDTSITLYQISDYGTSIVLSKSIAPDNSIMFYKKSDIISDISSSIQQNNVKEKDVFDFMGYNVSIYDTPDLEFDLVLIKDKKNIIWSGVTRKEDHIYGLKIKFLDIKRIGDDYILLYYNFANVTFDITHLSNDSRLIIERYNLPFFILGSYDKPLPKEGKILTENIVKLEYSKETIEHWKVRLSKEDVEKNIETAKKAGFSKNKIQTSKRNSLIWWNNIIPGLSDVNYKTDRAWNYNDDPVYEPFYENML